MFAVIRTGGKQYRVALEDIIEVEKIAGDEGAVVQFADVLMVGGEGALKVGTPMLSGASVAGNVVAQKRAAKILVFKKKRRKNYRRKRGHRQNLTQVRITEILLDGKAPSKAKAAAKKPASKAKADQTEPKAAIKKSAAKQTTEAKSGAKTKVQKK